MKRLKASCARKHHHDRLLVNSINCDTVNLFDKQGLNETDLKKVCFSNFKTF